MVEKYEEKHAIPYKLNKQRKFKIVSMEHS